MGQSQVTVRVESVGYTDIEGYCWFSLVLQLLNWNSKKETIIFQC